MREKGMDNSSLSFASFIPNYFSLSSPKSCRSPRSNPSSVFLFLRPLLPHHPPAAPPFSSIHYAPPLKDQTYRRLFLSLPFWFPISSSFSLAQSNQFIKGNIITLNVDVYFDFLQLTTSGKPAYKNAQLILFLTNFLSISSLSQTHSDQMPFRCEFCSRLFKHKRSRDRHIKLHTGDRKYRCTQCESAFSRSDHLKIHMKTHDNQKPFQCTVCNRGYNTAAALTSHMQSHKRGGGTGRNGGGGSTPSPGPTVLPTSPAPKAASTPTSEVATGRSSSGSRGSSPHRCLHCTAGFRKVEDLQAHMALHHSSGVQAPSPVLAETPRPRGRPPSSSLLPPRSCSASIPSPVTLAPKLACIYCTKDNFTTMEGLQLHVQAMHGSILNGDLRELAAAVGVVGALPHLGPTPIPPPSTLSPRLPSPTTSSSSTIPSSSASHHLLPFSCEFCTMRFDAPTALHKHALAVHAVPAVLGSPTAALSGPPLHSLHSPHHLRHPFPYVASSAPPPPLPPPPPPAPLPPPPSLPPEQVRPTDLSKKSSEGRSDCLEPPRAHEKTPDYLPRSKDYPNMKNNSENKLKFQDYSMPNFPTHRMLQHQAHQFLHAAAKSPPDFLSFAKSLRELQASVSKAEFAPPRKVPGSEPKRQRIPPEGEPSSLAGTLLCNQCDAALPDFESFRSHLKTHLEDEEAAARAAASGGSSAAVPGFTRRRSRKSNPHPRSGVVGSAGSPNMSAPAAGPSPPAASPPPNRRTRCPECEAEFSTESEAERHAVAAHFQVSPSGGASEFGCQSCGRRFPKPDELQKHLMDLHAHHLSKLLIEAKRQMKFFLSLKCASIVHFAVKHSNECKLYRCAVCTDVAPFRSEAEFVAHVRTVHLLPAWSGQRRHHSLQRQHPTPDTPTVCPPTNGVSQFRCLFCHLSLPTELELQFHLTTHRKEFKCVLCDEAFHVEFLLDKHVMEAHRGHMTNGMTSSSQRSEKPSTRTTPKKSSTPSTPPSPQPPSSTLTNGRPTPKEEEVTRSASGGLVNSHPAHQVAVVSLQCAYCNERCKSRSELETHTRAMHSVAVGATSAASAGVGGGVTGTGAASGGKHKCVICDELCASAVSLAEHKLARHCKVPEGSGCCVCKAPITGEEEFHAHVRRHATPGTRGNGTPSSTSSSSSSSSSPPPPLPTPCVVCRQTLVSEVEVRMHARFHLRRRGATDSTSVETTQVDQQVVRERRGCCVCLRTLTDEEVTDSGVEDGFPAVCTECRVLCGAAAGGGLGRLGEEDSGPYQCIKCQRGFPTEREIRAHVLSTHLLEGSHSSGSGSGSVGKPGGMGIGPTGSDLACHLCSPPSEWDSPLRLQAHLIEHSFGAASVVGGGRDSSAGGSGANAVVSGGSNFSCYLCGAVFTAAAGLQRHMPGHGLAQRPYDCSRCSLRFFFRSELENHMFSHRDDDGERKEVENDSMVMEEQTAIDLGAKSRQPKLEIKEETESEEVGDALITEIGNIEMTLKQEAPEEEAEDIEKGCDSEDRQGTEEDSGEPADTCENNNARKRQRTEGSEEAPASKKRSTSPMEIDCGSFVEPCSNFS
ncbi:hypothetical protein J437_LFUL005111 [Ladona fulva]|uniref:C2H2-type domain-containing protein n=1 Tax=Ladona fulva TaxID=123851 RepID=A0A8K0JYZ6_LADFU|nr:hypothetical protein J437_LFUL005111 [Ladona fulva]